MPIGYVPPALSAISQAMLDRLARMDQQIAGKADTASVDTTVQQSVAAQTGTLATQVAAVQTKTVTLEQLSADYQSALAGSIADRAAIHAQLNALAARTITIHRAQLATPLLALGAKADVAVTWQTPFPDAAYVTEVVVAPALLGKMTAAVKAGTQTAAGLTVTMTAAAAVAAGLVVDVTAVRFT